MMSKIDEIFKKVLNDRSIFWIREAIFNETEWAELKIVKDKPEEFKKITDNKINSKKIKDIANNEKKKNDLEKCLKLCEALKSALNEKPNILKQKFDYLNSYGLVKCNLPNMDDYGKVIERYGISTVEHFFLDKIKRENDIHKKKAIEKVLEYVKELYNANYSPLEIAYFVRKLNSLTNFWEVLNE